MVYNFIYFYRVVFLLRSSLCIPEGMLRKARDHKFVCSHKPQSAPGFMGLRPIPPSCGIRLLLGLACFCGGYLI